MQDRNNKNMLIEQYWPVLTEEIKRFDYLRDKMINSSGDLISPAKYEILYSEKYD